MRWVLPCVSILLPLGLFVHGTFVAPRPFYAFPDDQEHGYYYSARLAYLDRWDIIDIQHPGTPVQYLGSLILRISGSDLGHTQRFFDISYLIIALATAFALVVFGRLVLSGLPVGVALLSLAVFAAWPPFITYSTNFGADSFVYPTGLASLALIWRLLDDGWRTTPARSALVGAGLGACLAIKLTFVPVAVAALIACSVHVMWSPYRSRAKLTNLLALPVGTAVSFLLLTAPIFGRLPSLIIGTALRNDVMPAWGEAPGSFLSVFYVLMRDSLPFAFLMIVGAVGCVVLCAREAGRLLIARRGGFDLAAGAMFLSLMVLAFVYTMAASTNKLGLPLGMALEKASPTALFMPFLIPYSYRVLTLKGVLEAEWGKALSIGSLAIGLIVVAWPVSVELGARCQLIHENQGEIEAARQAFGRLREPGVRIAVWDGSPGIVLGEPSFHFWGNYRYANGYFDTMLAERYGEYAHFRLPEIAIAATGGGRSGNERRVGPRFLLSAERFGRRYWHGLFPPSARSRPEIIATGHGAGDRIRVIAFPEDELVNEDVSLADVASLVEQRFKVSGIRRASIAGTNWILLLLAAKGGAGEL